MWPEADVLAASGAEFPAECTSDEIASLFGKRVTAGIKQRADLASGGWLEYHNFW